MSFGFSSGEFMAFVEILLSIVLVLTGILVAVTALGFKPKASGSLADGSVQKAFNYRNESRKLFKSYLWFGVLLIVIWLVVALLDFSGDSWQASIAFLLASIILLTLMIWLLKKTYSLYFASTTMKGSATV